MVKSWRSLTRSEFWETTRGKVSISFHSSHIFYLYATLRHMTTHSLHNNHTVSNYFIIFTGYAWPPKLEIVNVKVLHVLRKVACIWKFPARWDKQRNRYRLWWYCHGHSSQLCVSWRKPNFCRIDSVKSKGSGCSHCQSSHLPGQPLWMQRQLAGTSAGESGAGNCSGLVSSGFVLIWSCLVSPCFVCLPCLVLLSRLTVQSLNVKPVSWSPCCREWHWFCLVLSCLVLTHPVLSCFVVFPESFCGCNTSLLEPLLERMAQVSALVSSCLLVLSRAVLSARTAIVIVTWIGGSLCLRRGTGDWSDLILSHPVLPCLVLSCLCFPDSHCECNYANWLEPPPERLAQVTAYALSCLVLSCFVFLDSLLKYDQWESLFQNHPMHEVKVLITEAWSLISSVFT